MTSRAPGRSRARFWSTVSPYPKRLGTRRLTVRETFPTSGSQAPARLVPLQIVEYGLLLRCNLTGRFHAASAMVVFVMVSKSMGAKCPKWACHRRRLSVREVQTGSPRGTWLLECDPRSALKGVLLYRGNRTLNCFGFLRSNRQCIQLRRPLPVTSLATQASFAGQRQCG